MRSRSTSISSGTASRPRNSTSANSSSRNSQNGRSSVLVSTRTLYSGSDGGELVVRIEDQDAQVGPRLDRLAQQQRDGGRLADAGGADDREVARQRVVDGDAGVDRLVLRQLADGDGVAAGEIVDRLQVARADAVGDGADMRIGGDAAVEDRLGAAARRSRTSPISSTLTSMALRLLVVPGAVGLADRVDQADGARRRRD